MEPLAFKLVTPRDRIDAYRKLTAQVWRDIRMGRIPVYMVEYMQIIIHKNAVETKSRFHLMTPVSLEPLGVDDTVFVSGEDYKFFLRLLLKLSHVTSVVYDPLYPMVIFSFKELKYQPG